VFYVPVKPLLHVHVARLFSTLHTPLPEHVTPAHVAICVPQSAPEQGGRPHVSRLSLVAIG
jgi:hypothetical protein